MNVGKRNVVLVGFNKNELNSISLFDIRTEWYEKDDDRPSHRFPYLIYCDTLKEAMNHQGFRIYIKLRNINMSKVEIDKYYRSKLKKYEEIHLYNNKFNGIEKLNKFSNVYFVGENIMFDSNLNYMIEDDYRDYLKKFQKKEMSLTKFSKIEVLRKYIQNKKTVSTKEIVEELGISFRSVQRYMHELNETYNNIGYDYSLNEWYYISTEKLK